MPNRLSRYFALLLAGLLFAAASPALAQPKSDADKPSAPDDKDDPNASAADASKKEEARAYFQIGSELQKDGKYDEAADAYRDAYKAFPMPVMYFNIGQALRLGGHLEEALDAYETFLDSKPKGDGARDARAFVKEIRAELDRRRAEEEKQKAEEARRAEEERKKQEALAAEKKKLVPYKLPSGKKSKGESPKRHSNAGRGQRLAGVSAGAAGLLALAGGLYFAFDGASAESDLNGYQGEWGPTQIDLEARGDRSNSRAVLFSSVGTVLLLAGGGLYWWGHHEEMAETTVAVDVSGEQIGFALSGRF